MISAWSFLVSGWLYGARMSLTFDPEIPSTRSLGAERKTRNAHRRNDRNVLWRFVGAGNTDFNRRVFFFGVLLVGCLCTFSIVWRSFAGMKILFWMVYCIFLYAPSDSPQTSNTKSSESKENNTAVARIFIIKTSSFFRPNGRQMAVSRSIVCGPERERLWINAGFAAGHLLGHTLQ